MDALLGQAARNARTRSGLRLIDIAAQAGLSQAALSRFERGWGFPMQTDEVVAAYAQACGLRPEDIWRAALDLHEGDPDEDA